MKILIVESDCEVIERVKTVIKASQPDWNLSFTTSGKECIDIVGSGNCPDIVIIGMQLSDMSGLELIEHIRDDSDIPIIFISDDKDVQTLVNAFEAGTSDYIVTPFSKAIFIARIKALVRRRDWDIQAAENKQVKVNN
jgi:DNA-binding response OmpR family regulator